jgi:hypothetical protein
VIAPTASSAATAAATPQAAPQPGPSDVASDRKVARKASVPKLPRGTAAATRHAAADPASAWVATSSASVAAGNGVSSPAQAAPAESRRAVTAIRHAAGASAPGRAPHLDRAALGASISIINRRPAHRLAARIAAAAIATRPAVPTSGSPPSPAATAA